MRSMNVLPLAKRPQSRGLYSSSMLPDARIRVIGLLTPSNLELWLQSEIMKSLGNA